jgi:hypothetical protein
MSYSLNQSRGSLKLSLQGECLDSGTLQNPTFQLNQTITTPPESYALVGIDKIVWQQPPLFPIQSTMLQVSSQSVYNSTTYNMANTALCSTLFVSGVAPLQHGLFDFEYDGTGGWNLVTWFNNIVAALNWEESPATSGGLIWDLWSPDFTHSSKLFWSSSTNKSQDASQFASSGHRILYLCFAGGTGTTTVNYVNIGSGLSSGYDWVLNRYFANTYCGTGCQVNFSTQYSAFANTAGFPVITGFKMTIPFEGVRYCKVMSNIASGYREGRVSTTGLANTSLLSVIPTTGYPGEQEIYVAPDQLEKLTINQMDMDRITLSFLDEYDKPLPLTKYLIVLSINFIDKDPVSTLPTMYGGRKGI